MRSQLFLPAMQASTVLLFVAAMPVVAIAQQAMNSTAAICKRYQGMKYGADAGKDLIVSCSVVDRMYVAQKTPDTYFSDLRDILVSSRNKKFSNILAEGPGMQRACSRALLKSAWTCSMGAGMEFTLTETSDGLVQEPHVTLDISSWAQNPPFSKYTSVGLSMAAEIAALVNREISKPTESYWADGTKLHVRILPQGK